MLSGLSSGGVHPLQFTADAENGKYANAKCKKAKWKMQINLHFAYKAGSLARLAPVLSCCCRCWCCHSALFECLLDAAPLRSQCLSLSLWGSRDFCISSQIWSSNWFSICAAASALPLRLAANGYKSIHTLPRIATQTDGQRFELCLWCVGISVVFCFCFCFHMQVLLENVNGGRCRGQLARQCTLHANWVAAYNQNNNLKKLH